MNDAFTDDDLANVEDRMRQAEAARTADRPSLRAAAGPMRDIDALAAALDRTLANFRRALAGKVIRDATETIMEAERALILARLDQEAALRAGGSLDEAWAEAEAALPGHRGMWLIEGVQLVDTSDSDDLNDEQLEWEAEAVDHAIGGQPRNVTALGPTPAAALRALAARLSALGEPHE